MTPTSCHNAIRWKLMKAIVSLIQEQEGIVFGGFVRDSIIHDFYATEFYSTPQVDTTRYSDPTYLPESFDRTSLPSDIDCYMLTTKLDMFKEKLKDKRLYISDAFTRDARIYIPVVSENNNLLHTTLKISFAIHKILFDFVKPKAFEIKIDIIHGTEAIEPPIGTIDFECNSVILTATNEYKLAACMTQDLGAKQKLDLLNTIIMNIIKRKTKITYDNVSIYRVHHMIGKSWDIESSHLSVMKYVEDTYDCCFICLHSFDKNRHHAKFKCCNGRMHIKCARRLYANEFVSCPHCRRDIEFCKKDKRVIA